jgi:hypothetical protein
MGDAVKMADDQGSSSIGLMPSELVGTIFDQKAVSGKFQARLLGREC